MQITIKSKFNRKGEWWPIETGYDISDNLSPDMKVKKIGQIIDGLTKAGMKPDTNQTVEQSTLLRDSPPPTPNGTPNNSPEFAWPAPHCGLHSTPLKISTVQTNEGGTAYFCPKRVGDGYCKHRATIDAKSGMPKFYEVN